MAAALAVPSPAAEEQEETPAPPGTCPAALWPRQRALAWGAPYTPPHGCPLLLAAASAPSCTPAVPDLRPAAGWLCWCYSRGAPSQQPGPAGGGCFPQRVAGRTPTSTFPCSTGPEGPWEGVGGREGPLPNGTPCQFGPAWEATSRRARCLPRLGHPPPCWACAAMPPPPHAPGSVDCPIPRQRVGCQVPSEGGLLTGAASSSGTSPALPFLLEQTEGLFPLPGQLGAQPVCVCVGGGAQWPGPVEVPRPAGAAPASV